MTLRARNNWRPCESKPAMAFVAVAALLASLAPAQSLPGKPLPDQLGDRPARVFAAWELAQQGEAALPALLAAARDQDPYVRRWALWALGLMGTTAAPAVPIAVDMLLDPVCQPTAIDTLARIGEAALPALRPLLAKRGRTRTLAATALARMEVSAARELALPILLEDLDDPAVSALAEIALLTPGFDVAARLGTLAKNAGTSTRAARTLATQRKPMAFRRTWVTFPIPARVRALWPRWYAPGDSAGRILVDLVAGEAWLRREAAWELRKRTEDKERARVLAALQSALDDPAAHAAAATALATFRQGGDKVIAGLRQALDDEELRTTAARLLAEAKDAEPALPALLEELLVGEHYGGNAAAFSHLTLMPARAVPILIEALRDARSMAARDALLLYDLVQKARAEPPLLVAVLATLVEHRDPEARSGAANRLASLGAAAAAAAPALARALATEKSTPVGSAMALALLRVAPGGAHFRVALPGLLARMEVGKAQGFDPSWPGANHPIASALLAQGPALIPSLLEILEQPTSPVLRNAALLLGRIRPPAADAVKKLVQCLDAPAVEVRRAAAWALGGMCVAPEACLDALLAALPQPLLIPPRPWQYQTDLSFAQKEPAAWAVVQFGAAAVPELLARLRAKAADPAGLVWLLGLIGAPAVPAAPHLVRLLQSHEDATVRHLAAWALGAIGSHPVFSPVADLTRALDDPQMRSMAIQALGAVAATDPAAVRALVQALPAEGGVMVRGARVVVLAKEGGPRLGISLQNTIVGLGPRAVPELKKLAEETSDPVVRTHAETILSMIEARAAPTGTGK